MAEMYSAIMEKSTVLKSKLSNYLDFDENGNKTKDYAVHLEAMLHNEDISQDQYVEGLKNAESDIRSILGELNNNDKEMFEAYSNALGETSSKIDDHVDHLEHISSVFDHYLNLMDLFGNSKDYEAMDNFLTGKAENSRNMLDIAKAELEMYREQKAEIEKDWIRAQ
jgi:ribosomal protein L20